MAFLVHADRAVGAVVEDEDDGGGARLDGGGKFEAGHLEVAVAREADHRAVGVFGLGGDGGGDAVAHGAGLGGEEALGAGVAEELVGPDGEVAGAVREDRVLRERGAEVGHDGAHVDGAGLGREVEGGEPCGAAGVAPCGPAGRVAGDA